MTGNAFIQTLGSTLHYIIMIIAHFRRKCNKADNKSTILVKNAEQLLSLFTKSIRDLLRLSPRPYNPEPPVPEYRRVF